MAGNKRAHGGTQCVVHPCDVWFPRVKQSEGHDYVDFYRVVLQRTRASFGTSLCITLGDIVTLARTKGNFLVTLIWSQRMHSKFVAATGTSCTPAVFLTSSLGAAAAAAAAAGGGWVLQQGEAVCGG